MKNRAPKRARMRRFQKCAVLLVASLFRLEPEASKSQVVQGLHQDAHTRTLAITFDDLPGAVPGTDHAMGTLRDLQRYNRRIINILTKHHVPAIGFVNEIKLQVSGERDVRAALLDRWLKGGLDLGNHTYSHVNFDQTSLEQFEDETVRGEVVTRALLSAHGKSERYFRHPALSTGPTQEAKNSIPRFLKKPWL